MKLYIGNLAFTKEKHEFEIIENGYILVKNNEILAVGQCFEGTYDDLEIIDYTDHLLIPGLVDLHFHAVQYGNLGIGLDEKLLDWLNDYTFKEEAKFKDLDYAALVFKHAIKHVISSGTTRIVFFSSIHKEATLLLMQLCNEAGLNSYVGKANMDRNSPEALCEDTLTSIEITQALLTQSFEHVKSIVTPRFVPSCSEEMMLSLGELAKQGYPVQTHISENRNEIEWVKSLHPESNNYLDVYDQAGLIGSKTILAHCVFCTPKEQELIKERGAFVAHCPMANFNLTSGIMNSKSYLDQNIHIGLGTDVGAGHTPSIREVMVNAIKMSKVHQMRHSDDPVLSFSEAFYMATKGGGKYFGKVGSFEPGYEFDMLVIQPDELSLLRKISPLEQLQRFVYAGKDDQIIARFSAGKRLKPY